MNELHISGWAFKPETRKVSSGKDLIRFALKYGNGKDKDGKWQNAFIPVKIFAEGLTVSDNQKVEIWGKIARDKWIDKTGKEQWTTYIFANRVETEEKEQEQKQDFVNDEVPF